MRSVLLEPSRMFHRTQAQQTSLGINYKFTIINIIKIKNIKVTQAITHTMQTGIELPQIVILSSDEHLNSHVDSRDRDERRREDLKAALVEAHVKTGQFERVHNRRAQLFEHFIRQSTHCLSFNFVIFRLFSF